MTNEVQCYDDGRLGGATSHKLHVQGLATFALSPGLPPYKLSIYVPGSKVGGPLFRVAFNRVIANFFECVNNVHLCVHVW